MFCCVRLVQLTKWHATRKDVQKNIESVLDSKAWKHTDAIYPEFGSPKRNVRLEIALYGVNLYSNQSLSHLTWQVVLLNYNLLLWLVTKSFFLMLVLLIPRKDRITLENIDVYLAPFIEELQ